MIHMLSPSDYVSGFDSSRAISTLLHHEAVNSEKGFYSFPLAEFHEKTEET
jgi:hypothetical protein